MKTGKVRYVIRNFPLADSHPLAEKAAEAALCAQEQGKYWIAHDYYLANQKRLGLSELELDAGSLGLDSTAFAGCVGSGKYGKTVQSDVVEGRAAGIQGTPTFFFGYQNPDNPSRINAVTSLVGNVGFTEFQKVIDDLIVRHTRGMTVKP